MDMGGRIERGTPGLAAPAMIPGEFGELLGQIEREAVPERLLELAVELQAALIRMRVREEAGRALVDG
jgi:hypothetical protein